MGKNYIFSSESVGEGHPDKVSDTISDAVLDACLAQDKTSRVACETFVKSNVVCVGGEITTKAKFDVEQVVRDAIAGLATSIATMFFMRTRCSSTTTSPPKARTSPRAWTPRRPPARLPRNRAPAIRV